MLEWEDVDEYFIIMESSVDLFDLTQENDKIPETCKNYFFDE